MNISTSRTCMTSEPLLVPEKLSIIKGDTVLKVRHTKITKELGICVRKVADKVFGCSDKNKNMSRFSFT